MNKLIFVLLSLYLSSFSCFSEELVNKELINSAKRDVLIDIKEKRFSFLTIYDGWGNHNLVGIGSIGTTCMLCGEVMCGDIKATFTAIQDTHYINNDVSARPSITNKYSFYRPRGVYASVYNTEMKNYFKKINKECEFEKMKGYNWRKK